MVLFSLKDLVSALEMCEARLEELQIQHAFIVVAKPTSPQHTSAPATEVSDTTAATPDQEVSYPQLTEVAVDLEQLHQIADEHKEKLQMSLVQQVSWGLFNCLN